MCFAFSFETPCLRPLNKLVFFFFFFFSRDWEHAFAALRGLNRLLLMCCIRALSRTVVHGGDVRTDALLVKKFDTDSLERKNLSNLYGLKPEDMQDLGIVCKFPR